MLAEARLVDHDHRLRRRAVDERERHRRVGRVVERALALDDDPVAERLALLDQPLDGALGEVADEPVDRDAPALDHHPGLAGRHERRAGRRPRPPPGGAPARPTSCRSRNRCRPSGSPACPGRGAGRPPSPSGPAAGGSRRSSSRALPAAAANSGSSPMNVCRPDRTSRPASMAAEDDRPPGRRAAGRRSGRCRSAARRAGSGEPAPRRGVATIGMSWPGRYADDVLAGPGRIEDRHDVVAAVADDAVRGLGAVGPELALGEDDEAAEVGRSHRGV